MELGSCDFAYVRVHRRTGKHRVLEEEEIKRYAREGWIVVPVLSSCLKFNYIFLSVAKIWTCLTLGSISAACLEEPIWFAGITGLHMTSRRPCWWWGTKPFSPLGTKLHFHVNYSRKSIHRFHIDHNAPCLPPKILHNRELFPISPGCYSRPKRSQRQRLRNFFFWRAGGGGGGG